MSLQVAKTILDQLGGNKFIAMTGSFNFVSNEGSEGPYLRMNLRKNKIGAKFLKITLNEMDTYDLLFFSIGKTELIIEKKKYTDIYCDQLQEIFTEATGLYTIL